jgi:hypothetical protein
MSLAQKLHDYTVKLHGNSCAIVRAHDMDTAKQAAIAKYGRTSGLLVVFGLDVGLLLHLLKAPTEDGELVGLDA